MTTVSGDLLPFYGQYPAGYGSSASSAASAGTTGSGTSSTNTAATSSSSSNPVDIIDIRSHQSAGAFTAAPGDLLALRGLYQGSDPAGGAIASYRVALRSDQASPNDGRLLLGNVDVTSRTSFTADEFGQLHFVAGPQGSKQDLVVVAQAGTRNADGTLSNLVDSPAVQITANITGTRSINAVGALLTQPTGSDASFVQVGQEATVFTGFGLPRPGLATAGNLTAAAGDLLALRGLYQGSDPAGGAIASYRVALRSDQASPNDGRLLLGNVDVTSRTSFTADEFGQLHFVAGPQGSKQDLVVVAQAGTRNADGTLSNLVDSPAVQITANVTGTCSINAVGALLTQPTGSDASFVQVGQEATVFTGFGLPRPGLATAGNTYEPQASADSLVNPLGAFQSSEALASTQSSGAPPAANFDLLSLYTNASGGSQTTGSTTPQQDIAQTLLTWALSAHELGGFQTAGSNFSLQRFAVAAYRTSQRST